MKQGFDLQRFLDAQAGGEFEDALAELRAGRKRSHWIWYVFPQLAGLGSSSMARRFGLDGIAEARAYLREPTLLERLAKATMAVHQQLCGRGLRIQVLMGSHIDALKLVSSMTLFEHVSRALSAEEPCAHLADLAAGAKAILATAAAQWFPACAFTSAALARS